MIVTRRGRNLLNVNVERNTERELSVTESKRKKVIGVDGKSSLIRQSVANDKFSDLFNSSECNEPSKLKDNRETGTPLVCNVSNKCQPPNFWRQHLENIRIMRSERDAQVDTMGCHTCSEKNASEKDKSFQILLSLILSSQTKDEVTSAAMKKLTSKYKNICSPDTLALENPTVIEPLIYPVSFYKRKAVYIVKASKILVEKYNGCLPRNYEQICALPGVGHKIATLAMNIAFGEIIGIGVDTHVHRIANRLGWTVKSTKTPLETKIALENWLPKKLWEEINVLLVGFGQQVCTPLRPKCNVCLNQSICPFNGKTAENDQLAKNLDF
uniref:Endonuclease III homolog n=1 Tax=Romanomermis culicivorax TaxID=13658 RepID=A0A915ILS4_ROMCU